MIFSERETDQADRKEHSQTVVSADQAALYERDGWEVIGYREEFGGKKVADIRRRFRV